MYTFYHIRIYSKITHSNYFEFDITDEDISNIVESLTSRKRILFSHNFVDARGIDGIWIITTSESSVKVRKDSAAGDDYTLFEFLTQAGMDITRQLLGETIDDPPPTPIPSSKVGAETVGDTLRQIALSKIFIVHGHDLNARDELTSMIQEWGLQPIVLGEQANEGRTLIEKLEHYALNVGYVFVLLTPDDQGGQDIRQLRPRARQNVILELGFFIGKFGRNKVCVLYKQGIEIPSEIPSDLNGLAYLPYQEKIEEIRAKIKHELRIAGCNLKP